MSVTTYCHCCNRVLHVPDTSVGRRMTCPCGESFRVEKPLAERLEEERQVEYWKRGLAFLQRYRKRGIGRPTYRTEVVSAVVVISILGLALGVWVEQGLLRSRPRPPRPAFQVRLIFADPADLVEETGTSTKDPKRPPLPAGFGKPAEEPGLDHHPVDQEVALSATSEEPAEREGSRERGRWRLVPEEANKLLDLEGMEANPLEGKTDPGEEIGVGSPLEGAPARPSDEKEPERDDATGRPGARAEREALDRISRESTGGGIRFFGTPLPLEGGGAIFVIDGSASMVLRVAEPVDAPAARKSWSKLDLAKWELKKAIAMLPEEKLFNVIFFDDCLDRWHYRLQPASPMNKKDAYRWLDRCKPQGQSNVSEAVVAALEEKGVNTIVLLSDGRPNVIDCRKLVEAAPSTHTEKIRQSNREGERIWCFGLSEDTASEAFLKRVAEESQGEYTPISAKPF